MILFVIVSLTVFVFGTDESGGCFDRLPNFRQMQRDNVTRLLKKRTWSLEQPLVSGHSLLSSLPLVKVQQSLQTQRRVRIHDLERGHVLGDKRRRQATPLTAIAPNIQTVGMFVFSFNNSV